MTRLTATDRATLAVMTETEWQAVIVREAVARGWEWAHHESRPRSPGSERGRKAITGTLARGWPDLILAHPASGRMIVVEVKAAGGTVSPDQARVLDVFRRIQRLHGWLQVFVWRPADYPGILEILA